MNILRKFQTLIRHIAQPMPLLVLGTILFFVWVVAYAVYSAFHPYVNGTCDSFEEAIAAFDIESPFTNLPVVGPVKWEQTIVRGKVIRTELNGNLQLAALHDWATKYKDTPGMLMPWSENGLPKDFDPNYGTREAFYVLKVSTDGTFHLCIDPQRNWHFWRQLRERQEKERKSVH